jgi:hypothetical protein
MLAYLCSKKNPSAPMPDGNSKRFHIRKSMLIACKCEIDLLVDFAFSMRIGLIELIPGNEKERYKRLIKGSANPVQ